MHPEDGRSMVLKIIDIYLPEYSVFFTVVLTIDEPPNNCDAVARTELPVYTKVLLLENVLHPVVV
jgi:hypothetical protein